jgi:hypothetical protein
LFCVLVLVSLANVFVGHAPRLAQSL